MAVLIGVSSRKAGGKTSLADALERHASDLWPRWEGNARIATPVRRLAMAEPIKQIAVDLLELPPELVYGGDDQKNTPTRYRWMDMPHYERLVCSGNPCPGPAALMTVRDILQQLGTEVFRHFFADIFINRWRRTARAWLADHPHGVVIADDVRFENEIEGMSEEGAFLFRLTRGVRGDSHASERDLDGHPGFHALIDNVAVGKTQAALEALKALRSAGVARGFDVSAAVHRLRTEGLPDAVAFAEAQADG